MEQYNIDAFIALRDKYQEIHDDRNLLRDVSDDGSNNLYQLLKRTTKFNHAINCTLCVAASLRQSHYEGNKKCDYCLWSIANKEIIHDDFPCITNSYASIQMTNKHYAPHTYKYYRKLLRNRIKDMNKQIKLYEELQNDKRTATQE